MKGRGALAFTWSPERALFERSENIALSDRERAEGFLRYVVVYAYTNKPKID